MIEDAVPTRADEIATAQRLAELMPNVLFTVGLRSVDGHVVVVAFTFSDALSLIGTLITMIGKGLWHRYV